MSRNICVGDPVYCVSSRPGNKRGCQIVFFAVPPVEVVTKTEVQGQTLRNLPVILEIGSHFQIAPMPEVAAQLRGGGWVERRRRARRLAYPRIYACRLIVGSVRRKKHLIVEIVGGTRHVEFAVLDIAPKVYTHLHAVVPVADRDQVGVSVNVLFEILWVAVVGAEARRSVSKPDRRHTAAAHGDLSVVLQVSHTSLIQNARAQGVHPTQRALREVVAERIAEPAGAGCIAEAKCIRLAEVVVLGEQPIVRVPIVIHPQRGLVSIKQIAEGLRLALESGNAVFLDWSIPVEGALQRSCWCVRAAGRIHVSNVLCGDSEQILPLLRHQWSAAKVCRGAQE